MFAALATSRWIEHHTGWSIKKFVRTARRYRTIEIQAGAHTITAADPLPDDLRDALETISRASGQCPTNLSQVGSDPLRRVQSPDKNSYALVQPAPGHRSVTVTVTELRAVVPLVVLCHLSGG